jgi:hypothetical protein
MSSSPLFPDVNAEVANILKAVAHNDAQAIKVLAGRGGKLRSAKPKQGIYAYIWRMCTFHSGIDPTMPVVAEMDLQRGIEEVLQEKGYVKFREVDPNNPFSVRRDQTSIYERDLREHKALMNLIDGRGGLVDRVLKQFGLDPLGAARRWRGLLASQKTVKTAARQMLLTAVDRKRLPALYSQEKVKDPIAYVRFFNAYGAGTWLATEFDGQDQFFGWAEIHPGMGELGYFSLRELQSLPARVGGRVIPGLQGIERDTSFTPKPLSQAKRA